MKPTTATKGELLRALRACVIVTKQGQPCYRTANGVPQGMPKRVEREVLNVITALGKT